MKTWPFVLIAGLLGLGLLVGTKFLPADTVLEFHGKVTEAGTGKPMPDTFVLINVMGYREEPITGHGNSGCIPASAAVRTDAQGNYHYRYDWSKDGDKGIPNGGVRMQVYKAGYERDVPVPTLGEWLIPGENIDFVLRKADTDLNKRLDFIMRGVDENCAKNFGANHRGWDDLYRAIKDEVWTNYCSDRGIWREHMHHADFAQIIHWFFQPRMIDLYHQEADYNSIVFDNFIKQKNNGIQKIVPAYSPTDYTDSYESIPQERLTRKPNITAPQRKSLCAEFTN